MKYEPELRAAISATLAMEVKAYEGYKLHAFRLKEALRFARAGGKRRISEITRTNLLDELVLMGPLEGKLGLGVFLEKLWPVDHWPRTTTGTTPSPVRSGSTWS
jgi:hypothetical protein